LESSSIIPEPHEFTVALKVSHGRSPITYCTRFVEDHHHHHGGDLPAAASPEYQDAHERAHAQQVAARLASQRVTTWQIVLFGLTGGLMPCSAAVAVLLVCLQIKQILLGFALVLAFSLGLAITLATAGAVAAVCVRQAAKRFKGFEDLARKMPYVSSAVMACIGLLIGIQGVRHLLH